MIVTLPAFSLAPLTGGRGGEGGEGEWGAGSDSCMVVERLEVGAGRGGVGWVWRGDWLMASLKEGSNLKSN